MQRVLTLEEFIEEKLKNVSKNIAGDLAGKYVSEHKKKTIINKKGKEVSVFLTKEERTALKKEFLKSEECRIAVEKALPSNKIYRIYSEEGSDLVKQAYQEYVNETTLENKKEELFHNTSKLADSEEVSATICTTAGEWAERIISGAKKHLLEDRLSFLDLDEDYIANDADDYNDDEEFYGCNEEDDEPDDDYDDYDYDDEDDYEYFSAFSHYDDEDLGVDEKTTDAYCEEILDNPEEYVFRNCGCCSGKHDIVKQIAATVIESSGELKRLLENDIDDIACNTLRNIAEKRFDYAISKSLDGDELADMVYKNRYCTEKLVKAKAEKQEEEERRRAAELLERQRQEAIKKAVLTAMPEQIKDAYPLARQMKRKFILHIGPTNSGKTHDALQVFREAENAVYLAPLRLLALEVAEDTNTLGVPCSMMTGEEEDLIHDASHISETIEMADLTRHYRVAVIDEAQMICDSDRGGAWTEAILGLCADEIHICMAPHAEYIVRDLISYCRDELAEVKRNERKTPLTADRPKFKFPTGVKDGDALIVFSKRSVISCAAELQLKGIPCSVIYGSLPYETRKAETERFARGETKVVVATDAIGMGLNLPVKRVVFLETEKYDGKSMRMLKPEEVQQIAGRAGRHGIYEEGLYSAKNGMPFIVGCMNTACEQVSHARLRFPEFLVSVEGKLADVMRKWKDVQTEAYFEKADISQQLQLCSELERFEVAKQTLYRLVNIPFNTKNLSLHNIWKYLSKQVIEGEPIVVTENMLSPDMSFSGFTGNDRIQKMEELYQKYDLIYYFIRIFGSRETKENDKKLVKDMKRRISDELTSLLKDKKLNRRQCPECGCFLPYDWPYRTCQKCYESRMFSYYW